MKKYAVCVDKILFLIFSCVERKPEIGSICSEIPVGSYAVLVLPSDRADVSLECYGSDGRAVKEPHLCFAALSFFLKRIRGLPVKEIEIEFSGKVYSSNISENTQVRFCKLPLKCKDWLSKDIIIQDKTHILCYDIQMDYNMRIFVAEDADAVSESFLRSLLVREGEAMADTVISVSYDGAVKLSATDQIYRYRYLASAISVLNLREMVIRDGEYTAHFAGGIHKFRLNRSDIIFLPEVVPLF